MMALPAQSLLVLLLSGFVSVCGAEAEVDIDEESLVLLLQTSAGLQKYSSVQPETSEQLPSQSDRLEAALPLVYVHVPKTGSSIVNAFLRLPGVCPDLAEQLGDVSYASGNNHSFEVFQNSSLCPGLIAPPNPTCNSLEMPSPCFDGSTIGDHVQLGNDINVEEHYTGHAVTMLRQPEQRVISGLRQASRFAAATNVELEDLQFSQGCAVRMLAGDEESSSSPMPGSELGGCFGLLPTDAAPPAVSAEVVAEAVARLQTFAFVGITEEWHLSVCLLHAMFGGECSSAEFENTRPSILSQASHDLKDGVVEAVLEAPEPYDTSILGGWVDEADRALYDAGLEKFHALCVTHGVTPEFCAPCYEAAGVL